MKLHLGVIDVPYSDEHSITTGDVATILEEEYGIMQTFYDKREDRIAELIAEDAGNALEAIMDGHGAPMANVFGDAMGEIERDFKLDWIGQQEVEKQGIPGTPTQAALDGKSKRLKQSSGPRRPSFIDSGEYQASFKAWVEA